jgi:nucleoside-diphosphate-sugar epimerase
MILITGASGFVGRQVLNKLELSGKKLRLIQRKNSSNIKPPSDNCEIIETDDLFQENQKWWSEVLSGVDIVIHIAWYVEPGNYLQSKKNIDCLIGTLELAKACIHSGVRRFIGIGTCFEYDLSQNDLSVETPLNPISIYAACKVSVYLTLNNWFKENNIEFAWCRLFYLFGEGERQNRLVPYLRSKMESGKIAKLTSGDQIRDFTDVKEAARLIVEVSISTRQGPFNICSGEPITIRKLAENIADKYGRRDLLKFGIRDENLVDPPRVVGVPNV